MNDTDCLAYICINRLVLLGIEAWPDEKDKHCQVGQCEAIEHSANKSKGIKNSGSLEIYKHKTKFKNLNRRSRVYKEDDAGAPSKSSIDKANNTLGMELNVFLRNGVLSFPVKSQCLKLCRNLELLERILSRLIHNIVGNKHRTIYINEETSKNGQANMGKKSYHSVTAACEHEVEHI